eukprot:TRINITY_DN1208_c0_g1_i4.p1 TRINITY_DN1208_c0_g1~~TRINITY_DN1208_c0_g1_i4.p1  ORF type:complete len:218 (-),score=57.18 TRINITY_DN1208_c0_g1_i4:452-1105(-)
MEKRDFSFDVSTTLPLSCSCPSVAELSFSSSKLPHTLKGGKDTFREREEESLLYSRSMRRTSDKEDVRGEVEMKKEELKCLSSNAPARFWKVLQGLLESRAYHEAFQVALEYNDDLIIHRLMRVSGAVLDRIKEPIRSLALQKAIKMLRSDQFSSVAMDWIEQAFDLQMHITLNQGHLLQRLLHAMSNDLSPLGLRASELELVLLSVQELSDSAPPQ